MSQQRYNFDYKYSGYLQQFIDALSKTQDPRDMLEQGFEVIASITRYKFIVFLERRGSVLECSDGRPRPRGFRAPSTTEVGRELVQLISTQLETHPGERYVRLNQIHASPYRTLAEHPGLGSGLAVRLQSSTGNGDYGVLFFGCADERILNTFELDLIESLVNRVLELFARTRVEREIVWGESAAMAAVRDMVEKVAQSEANVLIRGESGTGKELIARLIHDRSRRRGKVFVDVNCAALPETLLESELFGHEKGSFTGAISQKIGKFELANGGTLFLDEIGDTSLAMQVKMLRVLQEGEFTRVGGNEKIKTDIRVISATNQSLEELIEKGLFRRDLFYRLNVIPIYIPPLRERPEDIPDLVEHILTRFSSRLGIRYVLTPRAIARLQAYPWVGNVRELENLLERTITLASSTVIDEKDLRLEPVAGKARGTWDFRSETRPLRQVVAEVRQAYCKAALERFHGNKSKAAAALGISRMIFNRYLQGVEGDA
ncbi:MAG: sigma-54 dependent transcriptional regulator [candidate division KSB1 bacterium]|nr:sigma-54 dependent transcriptional regulator [candidate division KSB1 bacterium]MDZ7295183.1 sigma-54 dependent transcriptional regulator [candidate division KSB1 bacterium]MDZ7385023.1 sigma-54 dependent transcriptional regulator [candidate division KSB1 bacterium]MDZ7393370.1 sigma-54 dependent transcriptional regulator [candidate division KSB1 bacterium]MDZ7414134.1 sigma-54 dependent transcriptional regulator [candidate division KSB1 bacterium]